MGGPALRSSHHNPWRPDRFVLLNRPLKSVRANLDSNWRETLLKSQVGG